MMMSFDPSRILYAHVTCGKMPCTCIYDHKPVEFTLLKCRVPTCKRTFMVETERSEHHLSEHEVPYMVTADMVPLMQQSNGVHHG